MKKILNFSIVIIILVFNLLLLIKYIEVKEINIVLKDHLFLKNQENEELNKIFSIYTETNEIGFDKVKLKDDVFYLFVSPNSCFSCLEKSLWDIKGFLRDINQKIVIISSGWNAKSINNWILLNGEGYFSVLDSAEIVLSLPKLVNAISPCFFKVNANRIRLIHHFNSNNIEKTYQYLQNYRNEFR